MNKKKILMIIILIVFIGIIGFILVNINNQSVEKISQKTLLIIQIQLAQPIR